MAWSCSGSEVMGRSDQDMTGIVLEVVDCDAGVDLGDSGTEGVDSGIEGVDSGTEGVDSGIEVFAGTAGKAVVAVVVAIDSGHSRSHRRHLH
jgi:hypothetical protein